MPETRDPEIASLPSQPPISPPSLPAAPPSFSLYATLLLLAAIMITAAVVFGRADWAGLFVSLATNLIAAVIILLVIERRLRPSDAAALAALARIARGQVSLLFFRQAR